MTPEGKVKAKLNKLLACWDKVYRFMPVQSGLGAATLDYLLSVNSHFLAVETKAPGKKMTPRQEHTAAQIRSAGGTVIVFDGDTTEILSWLNEHTERKYEITPEANWRAKLKQKYGITPEDYDRMVVAQGGHCVFCSRTPAQEQFGRLSIDHCHQTKRVRGLLCKMHNGALKSFGDNEAAVLRLLDYVK